METLIAGASGATGKHLVNELLKSGQKVKIIVRSTGKIPESWASNDNLKIIRRDISEISIEEMSGYLADCQAAASCLGHNLSWKGVYGKPRKLVSEAVRLMCDAIIKNKPAKPVKFVLMNTAGNSNRDLNEPVSFGQKIIITLLRLFLPPHTDNENAADYLRVKIGQKDPDIEWVAVRPDSLINEEEVTDYSLHISPTRSAIFNSGKTSRLNVGHFMASLITDDGLWQKWKGQMPVIYNESD